MITMVALVSQRPSALSWNSFSYSMRTDAKKYVGDCIAPVQMHLNEDVLKPTFNKMGVCPSIFSRYHVSWEQKLVMADVERRDTETK